MPPPPSLTCLVAASKDTPPSAVIDLMGIVSDFFPPSKTRYNEYMTTFELQDHDMINVRRYGLKVRFFASRPDDLPRVQAVGDVVLIRQCSITSRNSQPFIRVTKGQTSTVVFPAASIPKVAFQQAYATGEKSLDCTCLPSHLLPSKAEQLYAIDLNTHTAPLLQTSGPANMVTHTSGGNSNNASIPPPNKDKFSLIKNVQVNEFRDLVVQVIKKYYNQQNNIIELYVSDYTENPMLFDYPSPDEEEVDLDLGRDGDMYGYQARNLMPVRPKEWPGPYGQRVLMVELHPPHATFADKKLDEGTFVMLQNVRIKLSRNNKLEGNMYPDKRYPDKVLIHKLRQGIAGESTGCLDGLMQRKDTYEKKLKDTAAAESRKKDKKRLKNKKRKGKNDDEGSSVNNVNGGTGGHSNKNVRCQHEDISLTTLAELLSFDRDFTSPVYQQQTTPFINQRRRVRVRVVDFWPPTLEAFARSAVVGTEGSDDETIHTSIDDRPSQKWEWDFFLLLEDARARKQRPNEEPARIWAHVDHGNAQYLLAFDDDPTDLYQNNETLAKLRDTLFLLWGNLDEAKTAARKKNLTYPSPESETGNELGKVPPLSNVPFDCCIEERGMQTEQEDMEANDSAVFVRVYDLFGTRILGS